MKTYPTKHFVDQMSRGFDMSVITMLLHEAKSDPNKINFEVTNGHATVVAVRENNTLKLITGWVGNRQKAKIAA